MPKFSIYEGAGNPNDDQRVRCEIGWTKGYDVQIGVTELAEGLEAAGGPSEVFDDSPTNTTITVSDGAVTHGTATHGSATPVKPGPLAGPAEPAWQGRRMHLSRSQINTLIRTLREARDAAYGRDE